MLRCWSVVGVEEQYRIVRADSEAYVETYLCSNSGQARNRLSVIVVANTVLAVVAHPRSQQGFTLQVRVAMDGSWGTVVPP